MTVVQTPTPTPQRSPSPPTPVKSMVIIQSTDVNDQHCDVREVPTVRDVACDPSVKDDVSSDVRSEVLECSASSPLTGARRTDGGELNSIIDTLPDMVDLVGVCSSDCSVLAFDTMAMNVASSEDTRGKTIAHSNNSPSDLLMSDPCGGSKCSTVECEQVDLDSFDELIASLLHFADNGADCHSEHSDLSTIKETPTGNSSVTDISMPLKDVLNNNKRASFHRQANTTASCDEANHGTASPTHHYEPDTTEISDTGNRHITDDVSTVSLRDGDVEHVNTMKNDDEINMQIKLGDIGAGVTASHFGDCEIRFADVPSPIRSKPTGSIELSDNASFDDCVEVGWNVNNLDDSWSGESKKTRRQYEVEIAGQSSYNRCEEICNAIQFDRDAYSEFHDSCRPMQLAKDDDCVPLNDHLDSFERRDADDGATSCIRYPTDANSGSSIFNAESALLGIETASGEQIQSRQMSEDYTEDDDDDVWNSASEQSQITARSLSIVDEDFDSDFVDNRTEVSETASTSSAMVDRSGMADESPARQRQTSDMDVYMEKALVESVIGSIGEYAKIIHPSVYRV